METVIIVIHLMVIVALVAVVLMQRSEGGALGIGGGGNFMSARAQGNVLTRATAILAAAFQPVGRIGAGHCKPVKPEVRALGAETGQGNAAAGRPGAGGTPEQCSGGIQSAAGARH